VGKGNNVINEIPIALKELRGGVPESVLGDMNMLPGGRKV